MNSHLYITVKTSVNICTLTHATKLLIRMQHMCFNECHKCFNEFSRGMIVLKKLKDLGIAILRTNSTGRF